MSELIATQAACPVCGNSDAKTLHSFRDNMFGTPGEYPYAECPGCGLLWQLNVPQELSEYYRNSGEQESYYSFNPKRIGGLQALLKRLRLQHAVSGKGLLGKLAVKRWGEPAIADWIRHTGVTQRDAILDVGCGGGGVLREFEIAGYTHLYGIDPFLPADVQRGALQLQKRDISEEQRRFDLVMFHHSFEHVRDPRVVLHHTQRLLHPGGKLLIRTPVGQTYAWRTFGKDWFQLEAPRHLFIHSVKSLTVLAEEAGFELQDVQFDSSDFMFWTSIQDQHGIALRSPNSYDVDPAKSMFSPDEINEFRTKAQSLNRDNDGDAAAFYFVRR
jgi:2-polyprenyl-3-methyl-5-hydroxy-6-metoxy-1,4-benzoquinol methylase